jgi:hypothetical protein
VLVGSGAVLLGYTAFRPHTPSYYGAGGQPSTQPSSYHGGGYRGGHYVPVPYRSGRGYSGSSGSSGSPDHYSGVGHSSGTSRGGFGSSGRSSAA